MSGAELAGESATVHGMPVRKVLDCAGELRKELEAEKATDELNWSVSKAKKGTK
jgi:hypothetical protein